MLLAEVYERVGLIRHCEPGEYSQQWHLHHSEELFLEVILHAGGRKIEGIPQPGDIAMFVFGRCASHGSIVLEWPMVIHAYIGIGVTIDNAENSMLKGRFVGAYTMFGGV
jgi:cell wall-associated NlpC family hydrolase